MNGPVPQKVEKGFTIFALFIITGPFSGNLIPLLQREFGLGIPGGAVLSTFLTAFIYGFTAGLLLLNRKAVLFVLSRSRFFWIPVLVTVVSASWSVVPHFSLKLGLALVITTSFGLYLAVRYSPGEQLRLLLAALGIAALLSFFLVVLFPSYGISGPPNEGCWQGIYIHKNLHLAPPVRATQIVMKTGCALTLDCSTIGLRRRHTTKHGEVSSRLLFLNLKQYKNQCKDCLSSTNKWFPETVR